LRAGSSARLERSADNRKVAGSNPARPTMLFPHNAAVFSVFRLSGCFRIECYIWLWKFQRNSAYNLSLVLKSYKFKRSRMVFRGESFG
jgi:hypothetical protein